MITKPYDWNSLCLSHLMLYLDSLSSQMLIAASDFAVLANHPSRIMQTNAICGGGAITEVKVSFHIVVDIWQAFLHHIKH